MTAYSTPGALRLSHFLQPRRMWPGIAQWPQVIAWSREGLLSVKPVSRDQADVTLTDKGRAELEDKQ